MRRAIAAALLAAFILLPFGGLGARHQSFTFLLYCAPWWGCTIVPFYTEEVTVIASYGRLDADYGGWGIREHCEECEIADFPQFELPAPEPVVPPCDPGCGDERDLIICEYVGYPIGALYVPTCDEFATGGGSAHFDWGELNVSPGNEHYPWGIIKGRLLSGLESMRTYYSDQPIIVTSGYRCPYGNQLVGGVGTSRHQYGDAADLKPRAEVYTPANQDEFNLLRGAALDAGASYATGWDTYTDRHLHVQFEQ